jgi:hypothetical protein
MNRLMHTTLSPTSKPAAMQLRLNASVLVDPTTNTETSAANLHHIYSLASPFILAAEISNIVVDIRLRSAACAVKL